MANARDTIYWEACLEKGERMEHKDPWKKTRQRIALFFIFIGWILFAMIVYQISSSTMRWPTLILTRSSVSPWMPTR